MSNSAIGPTAVRPLPKANVGQIYPKVKIFKDIEGKHRDMATEWGPYSTAPVGQCPIYLLIRVPAVATSLDAGGRGLSVS